jgi:hypothetical protein
MDHYIPKRRLPVTLWSRDLQGVSGHLFLDLDVRTARHQTLLDKLNEASPFLPMAVGPDGQVHLFHRERLARVTPGPSVIHSDVYSRGFQPWREERADMLLDDGARLSGHVWTPLERDTQRLSDFMNVNGTRFFVLRTAAALHLVNGAAVVELALEEGVGAPIGHDGQATAHGLEAA